MSAPAPERGMTIPMIAFDLETTGVDVFEDRIVTAHLSLLDERGNVALEQNWVLNPGIEIPEGAAAVHGYDTARVQREGSTDVAGALRQIYSIIEAECAANGRPLTGFNLSYDLSLLECERARHAPEQAPLSFGVGAGLVTVLDGLVLDKAVEKYRKGSRKLIAVAEHWGIPISEDEAHTASFDAVASGRLVQRLLRHDRLAGMPLDVIWEAELIWAREQRESLLAYFRSPKGNKPDAEVDLGWPLHSALTAATPEAVAA